ncbi:hypothetical protein MTO96_017679 [Rhipicephalus appendiculatus]
MKSPAECSKFLIQHRRPDRESEWTSSRRAESRDRGKPIRLARTVDTSRAVHNFRTLSHHYPVPPGDVYTSDVLHYTVLSAVDVVAAIVPWNLPSYLLTFKLAPVMLYGNTVAAKPSERTSVTAWMLAKVFVDAGLPPGVINFVFGFGQIVGDALMGGQNAAVVCEDADLNKCIAALIKVMSCFPPSSLTCRTLHAASKRYSGPVTCLAPFESDLEVVEKVIGVSYELCASIWFQGRLPHTQDGSAF